MEVEVSVLDRIVDRSPNAMTGRARVYLAAAGTRHGFIGLAILTAPWLWGSAVYIPIFNLLPLPIWGVIMTIEGIACYTAAIGRNATVARVSMVISAVVTLVIAAGLAFGVALAWAEWVQVVGWGRAWELLLIHPDEYPFNLRPIHAPPPSPYLPIVMLALTVKDFAMCAQPLRVPLEESVGDLRLRGA